MLFAAGAIADTQTVTVSDDASLRTALRHLSPGRRIRIAPGNYRPGVYVSGVHGNREAPIVIEGADPHRPPLFEGGGEGWHLSDCSYVVLRNVAVRGQRSNGINIDDGGSYDTPAHHILLESLHVADIGPTGNHDAIKLSGVDHFTIRRCRIEGWGGQAIDMVGCHDGRVHDCEFRGKTGYSQHTGPQTKGGSSNVTVEKCRFIEAGGRAMQIGGSTGLAYFRPQGVLYEAKNITVRRCVFVGSDAPITFVGVDGAVVQNNTIFQPRKWVLRILQENINAGFAPCRNGRFERNMVVFHGDRVRVFVNIGPHTAPQTFQFVDNAWYREDRPAASRPNLPTTEIRGLYGINPDFAAPHSGDFTPRNPRIRRYGSHAE
jgi:hypothetical protein